MTQRNRKQGHMKSLFSPSNLQKTVISPTSSHLSRKQFEEYHKQSNPLFSETQTKFNQLMSQIEEGDTKCLPLASHYSQRRTIGTTQNKTRRHISSQDQSELTTRASANLKSFNDKGRSAFNLVTPGGTSTKMNSPRMQKTLIDSQIIEEQHHSSSIFINQQIQQASQKFSGTNHGNSKINNSNKGSPTFGPMITERFVKRDEKLQFEPCPEGIMNVNVKELQKIHQSNIKHAQQDGKSIQALRNKRRGLSDSLITQAEADEPQVSQSPKRVQEILDPQRKPLENKISIDFPRPLRIASTDGTVDDVRSVLRYNFLAHQEYNPVLDSLKSRLLLKGVYAPNIETQQKDLTKNVNDFVKQNKNHKCENFTISDLYDQDMVAKEKQKAEDFERRLLQSLKPPSIEQLENKLHFINMIKGNSNRNWKEITDHKRQKESLEPQVGPHKLTKDQQRHVFALIDKRDETVSNKNLPLSSYVNQLETLLDQGWYVEYIEKGKKKKDEAKAHHQGSQEIKSETGGDQIVSIDETSQNETEKKDFSQIFKEKFKEFIQKKIQEAKSKAGKKSQSKHFVAPIDEILSKQQFQNDEVLGAIKIQAIKEFSQYCKELKIKENQEKEVQRALTKKKQDSLTDLAFNTQQADNLTTQAGSFDQKSAPYLPYYKQFTNPQNSQMIMFIDTHDSVETTTQSPRLPYKSRQQELQQEQLINKSIQIDKMIQLYRVKTKAINHKDKWKELENMKTNSKIMIRGSNSHLMDSDSIKQFQSKISIPSTAGIQSRKFDILTTQDSRQTIQDNLYQRNIMDTTRSLDQQQFTDPDETLGDRDENTVQAKTEGPSQHVLQEKIKNLRQHCMDVKEANHIEDLRIKARHRETLDNIWMKEERFRKAIESYQDEQLIKMLHNDKHQLLCAGIIEEDLIQDGENYDNFLRPEHVNVLRSEKMQMIKTSLHGRTKIWKAKKFEYPNHVRQILISQKDEVRRRSLQEFLRK